MKLKTFLPALLLGSTLAIGSWVKADEIVKPTAAPVVSDNAERASVDEPAVIDHVVYLAKLPSPEELMRGADLKATPIVRMDQTADRIVVVYQYAGGRTVTFAYTLLSKTASTRAPVVSQNSTAEYQVVTPAPAPRAAPTVVYSEPEVVYYTPRVRYYDPAWDFWTPLAVGVGLGWGFGHGHGHSYGGWHGHGAWRH